MVEYGSCPWLVSFHLINHEIFSAYAIFNKYLNLVFGDLWSMLTTYPITFHFIYRDYWTLFFWQLTKLGKNLKEKVKLLKMAS